MTVPTPLKVLILEDAPSDAALMVDALRQAGFDPEWQRVQTEAEYVAHLDPALDVILADYTLPQFDGLTALALMRERRLEIPFIIVSGIIGEERAVAAIKQGADDYLMKDRLARLGPAVTGALQTKRLRAEKRHAEAEWRASEERYRRSFELGLIGMALTSPAKGFLDVNDELCRILGYERTELLQMTWAALTHPDDVAADVAQFDRVMAGAIDDYSLDQRWIRKDGRVIDSTISVKCLRRGDGAVEYFVALVQDISERRQALAEIQSLAQFPAENPYPVLRVARDGTLLYANVGSQPLLAEWKSAIGLGLPADLQNKVDEAFATNAAQEIEVMCGDLRYSLTVAHYRETGYANIYGLDITDRKRAFEANRLRAQEFSALVEHSPDPIGRFDRLGRHLYVNPAVCRINQQPAAHFLGRSNREIGRAPLQVQRWEAAFAHVLATGQETTFEFELATPGNELVFETRLAPEFAADGSVETVLSISRDVTRRVRAEQALSASEAHFRLLAEYAKDIIYRYEFFPTPHLSYISPAVTTIFGYTPEEYYADPGLIASQIHPDDEAILEVAITAPVSITSQTELRWRTKDDRILWMDQRSEPICDADGRLVASVGIARDITERKRNEEELRKLSRAVEQSPTSIIITDVTGRIEYVNPKLTELTGYTWAEVIGQNPSLLKSGHTPPDEYARLWQTITAGGEWRGEFHNKSKSGKLYWESASISPILDDHGKITHFLAVKEDISERKRREQERESLLAVATAIRVADSRDAMLSVILHQIALSLDADRTFFADADPAAGEIVVDAVYENGASRLNLGISLPPGRGISWHVYQTRQTHVTDDIGSDPLFVDLGLISDRQAAVSVPLLTPAGCLGVLQVTRRSPWTGPEVQLLEAIADMAATGLERATLHEQTLRHAAELERKVAASTRELSEANNRLLELDRLKSKFVADVSHELRTPVTNMGLYLKLLDRRPERREQYMAVLREQAGRLQILVKDVLDVARLDNDQSTPLAPVNLNDLVTHVVVAHQARAESQDLTLTFEPDPALPLALGHPDKLIQIVTNLVANAVNYTHTGGITVRTFVPRAPQRVALEVTDTGTGIHPEDIPHLFDRFYRGRRDQIATVPGTGLGLSIVKELVERHDGAIEVQSQLGFGSTFTVTLRAAQAEGNDL